MSQIQREQLRVVSEKAVLVGVQMPGRYVDERDPLSELRALATTAGAKVVGEMVQKRDRPYRRTYLGKGKVQELKAMAETLGATLVIFDNDLTPAQIRNLEQDLSPITRERKLAIKILDRSELILDIFANRAATHAAKLQVEIAQLEYTYPRLRAMWDHLGQIVGGAPVGIGTRGPGEQQLEIDRRIVQRRLAHLKRGLEDVQARKTREVKHRNTDHYTVGLVGYTNAGKSTLFNTLTTAAGGQGGGAFAHEKLFATLSTRVEKWKLARGNEVLLSDTVGFIRDLPHHLVASFRSTLEETVYADLLLIVLDVSDPNAQMQLETVHRTLDEIGAKREGDEQPRVVLLNKVDLLPRDDSLDRWLEHLPEAVPISAATGTGLDRVEEMVMQHMLGGVREVTIHTPQADTKTIAFLEQRAEVLDRQYENGEAAFTVRIGRRQVDQLLAAGASMRINERPALEEARRLWDYPEPAKPQLPDLPPHEKYWS